jgi:hypothetical protein
MRIALIYWIIGCILVGIAWDVYTDQCPNDPEIRSIDALAVVALWPAAIVAGIFPHDKKPLVCKVP